MPHAELLAAEENDPQTTIPRWNWGFLVTVVLSLAIWAALIAGIVELV